MPNLEIASSHRAPKLPDDRHVPSHGCIRLEDSSQARTSSIDREWETLSAVLTPSNVLPTVSARPRMETLPGIGVVDLPVLAVAPEPRRSAGARFLISVLAATLASSAVFVGISAWQSYLPNSDAGELAPVALVAAAPLTRLAEAQSLPSPSPVALAPEVPATASNTETPSTKTAGNGKPQQHAASTALRASAEASAPRPMTTKNLRPRKAALAPTDNPY